MSDTVQGGDVLFRFIAEDEELQDALAKLQGELEGTGEAADDTSKYIEELERRFKELEQRLHKTRSGVSQVGGGLRVAGKGIALFDSHGGRVVGTLGRLISGFGKVGAALGPAGVAAVAVTGAFVATAAATVKLGSAALDAMHHAHDLHKALQPFHRQGLLPQAEVAKLDRAAAAMDAVKTVAKALTAEMANQLAPAVGEVAILLVKLGLAGVDAMADIRGSTHKLATFFLDNLLKAISTPFEILIGVSSELAKVLSLDLADSIADVGDSIDKIRGGAASDLADMLLDTGADAAGDAFANLNDRLSKYDETARKIVDTQAQVNEQARTAEERQRAAAKAAQANAEAHQMLVDATSDLRSPLQQINFGLQQQRQHLDGLAAAGAKAQQVAQTRAAVEARAVRDTVAVYEEQWTVASAKLDALQVQANEANAGMEAYVANQAASIQSSVSMALTAVSDLTATLADKMAEHGKRGAVALFRVSQAAALATIAVNTAVARTKALAVLGPLAGPLAAAAITAAGLASAAAVAAQAPPEVSNHLGSGGLGARDPLAPDEGYFGGRRVLGQERVLNSTAVNTLGEEGVNDLQRGRMPGGGVMRAEVPYKQWRSSMDRELGRSARTNSRFGRSMRTQTRVRNPQRGW